MSKFTVGDKVTWVSQAGGYRKTKTGTVVRVLTPHDRPTRVASTEFPGYRRMFDGMKITGGANTGYLVEVNNDRWKKPRLYLPYPNKLEKAKA